MCLKKKIAGLAVLVLFAVMASYGQSSAEEFGWPVPGYKTINARYTYPSSGNNHSCRYRTPAGKPAGIDIGVPSGTQVLAPADGTVQSLADLGSSSFGKYFEIKHDDGTITLYGHLSSFNVYNGQRVNRGSVIGWSGSTGNSTGPHLHYEMTQRDVLQYYEDNGYRDPRYMTASAPIITSVYLPSGVVGESYSGYFTASGTAPIEYSINGVARANGLQLNNGTWGSTGAITGVPVTEHTFTVKLTTSNSAGSDSREVNITVVNNGKGPRITTSSLPNAERGVYYSQPIAETGGTYPIKWAVHKGSLPPGLSLSNTSERTTYLTGIPTTNGEYTFTIRATDSSNTPSGIYLYDIQEFKIVVSDPKIKPKITSVNLPSGVVGESYSGYFTASGTAPIEYSISGVGIANGLHLNSGTSWGSTGEITGIPTTEHTFTVKLTASNSAGSDSREVSIKVVNNGKGPSITTSSPMPTAERGVYYSQPITITGGTLPIKWELLKGTLPPGLSLSSSTSRTVYLTGTPTTNGEYTFTILATDSTTIPGNSNLHLRGFKEFKIVVRDPITPPLAINGDFTTSGKVGTYYSSTIAASGGTPPYTWNFESGNIPSDSNFKFLSFPYTSARLTLSGTPQSAKTYNFRLSVKDAKGNKVYKTFPSVVIKSTVTAPKIITTSLPDAYVNEPYRASITATGTAPIKFSASTAATAHNLTCNSSTGVITGTPDVVRDVKIVFYAENEAGQDSVTLPLKIKERVVAPKITTTSLKQGQVGTLYRDKIRAAGTAPITFSISAVGLANGLRCDSTTGDILGTPNKAITFNLTITAKNSAGSDSKTLPVTIKASPFTQNQTNNNNKQSSSAPLKIEGSFSDYSVNKSASGSINVSGGTAPYKWTYTGTTPAGMKITSTGAKATLSGKPSKKGSNTFTIKVTDKDGKTLSKKFTVNVTAPQPVITGSFSNSGKLNKSYTGTITLTKGTAPYKATASGKIPAGLKLSISGSKVKLSGKPSKTGTFKFTLKVTDKNKEAVSKTFTVKIAKSALKLSGSLSSGKVGKAYNKTITVKNGTAPYKWTCTGKLPEGIKLTSSGAKAKFSGKPTQAGTFKFTLKAADKDKASVSKTFTIKIAPKTTTTSSLIEEAKAAAITFVKSKTEVYKISLEIMKTDIISQGTGRDEDLFEVRENKPLTFIIVSCKDSQGREYEISNARVFFDYKYNEDIAVSYNGIFTIPAELVRDDFVVSIKAEANNHDAESEEFFINAIK